MASNSKKGIDSPEVPTNSTNNSRKRIELVATDPTINSRKGMDLSVLLNYSLPAWSREHLLEKKQAAREDSKSLNVLSCRKFHKLS